MKNFKRLALAIAAFILPLGHVFGQSTKNENTWTFTYLKASAGQRENLKTYLEKNWFAMDSIAVEQNLINKYELIENVEKGKQPEWDYVVAVEYYTQFTYADIAGKFEEIRKRHKTQLVNGLTMKDLGEIIKSETVRKKRYK